MAAPTPATTASFFSTLERPTPRSSSSASASSVAAPSILFDSAVPAEAQGFGETRILSDAERGHEERAEKHSALLRALYSVAISPSTPRELTVVNGKNDGCDESQRELLGEQEWEHELSADEKKLQSIIKAANELYEPWNDVEDYRESPERARSEWDYKNDDSQRLEPWDPARHLPSPQVDSVLGPESAHILDNNHDDSTIPRNSSYDHERATHSLLALLRSGATDGERRTASDSTSPDTRASDLFVDAPTSPPSVTNQSDSFLSILNGRGVPATQQSSPSRRVPSPREQSFAPSATGRSDLPFPPQNQLPVEAAPLQYHSPLPTGLPSPEGKANVPPIAPFSLHPSEPYYPPPHHPEPHFQRHSYSQHSTQLPPLYSQPPPNSQFPPLNFSQPPPGVMFSRYPPGTMFTGNYDSNNSLPQHFSPPHPSLPSQFSNGGGYPSQRPGQLPPPPLFNPHSPQRPEVPSMSGVAFFAPFSPERQRYHQPLGQGENHLPPSASTVANPAHAGQLLNLFNGGRTAQGM
ncbi:hypothetical protein P7C70_g4307, partial [Phenoliferia sp. Uapishka_3]